MILSIAVLLVVLSGELLGQPSFEDLANRARTARESGQLARAADLYEQALASKPDWADGWWSLGALRYDLEEYPKAKQAFVKLVGLHPETGVGWGFLGLVEYELHSYERALENLQQADRLGLGANKELVFLTSFREATLLTRFERFDEAYRLLLLLAGEDPDNPKVMEALGICLLRLPKLPAELDPGQAKAVQLAGQAAVYNWLGRQDDAAREYQELVQLYPSFPNVHYAYGVFLLKSDSDAALKEFRKELDVSPDHVASILQIAYEQLRRRRPEQALPQIQHVLDLLPHSPSATAALGKAYLQMGEYEKALTALEEAVELAPDSAELHAMLTTLCFRLGRKEEAQRHKAIVERLRTEQQNKDATLRELRAKTQSSPGSNDGP